jgi:transposase
MPKSRPPYPPEFRQRIIEPTAQTIRNWLAQADRDAGQRSDGLTTDEREELRRLRRENKTLREEREILKKAAAWFAKETGSIPSKDSSS